MNKVFLIGNLTRDPEVTTTGSGISVCKFSIAVNRNYSNASGERETDFFNITAWRGLGENCGKYLVKGSKVAVIGEIQIRSYEVDGQKRTSTDIVADNVEFLNKAGESTGGSKEYNSGGSPAKKQNSELKPIDDEGLPF